ncbi:putative permease [Candidatus Gugararchaeum adminiculabundum]|nr:putative permease [Candidatus Gugararchaeum adminiculabundum]
MILEEFADWVTYSILGLAKGSQLGNAANFFVYDSIKVAVLLAIVVFLVGVVRTFVTPQKVKQWLGGRREGVGNIFAALLGIPTPFCSCSAVPLFIGFVEAGVPLGITFSFLISSPLINEIAATLLFAMFGWQIAALYIGTGFVIAVVAGIVIGRMGLEGEIEEFVNRRKGEAEDEIKGWKDRVKFGLQESRRITLKVLPFLLIGIAIGALVHGYVGDNVLADVAGRNNPLAVPIAVLIGIPLYSNAAGMVPIVGVLISKGVAVGTALAFMMSVIGLSLPEIVILRRVLKPKLLAIFVAIMFASFVLTGYLLNLVIA